MKRLFTALIQSSNADGSSLAPVLEPNGADNRVWGSFPSAAGLKADQAGFVFRRHGTQYFLPTILIPTVIRPALQSHFT
jgi:hypothetical protein